MSSWQIACSLFSPLRVPVGFSFSGALMINGSSSDFHAESHLCVHRYLLRLTQPPAEMQPPSLSPPILSLSYLPPSFLVTEYDPPLPPLPNTLAVTGPSVWPPLNCSRLELCHSGSCCIVFGNGAYGTWTGKWVCEDAVSVWLQLVSSGKTRHCTRSHLSIHCTEWLFTRPISLGFDV